MRRTVFFGLVLLAGFVGGLVVSGRMSITQKSLALPGAAGQTAQSRPPTPTGSLPDLSPVAERALKVAANISSTTVTVPNDPYYRFFYGEQPQPYQSLGSGVVVSSSGYVLTNSHVIGDARADIRVTLADGRERPGRLVGIDDVSDLAVVKVDATNLETLPWGDSSKLRVAEWVLAIGNPFQLSGTVTLGIVSTVSRSGVGRATNFIQTDAAINKGNSGGALVNARGELVGINSLIYSETGGYQGIGFAIPSNDAHRMMDELISNGVVRWGSIQVVCVTIDRSQAQYYGLGDAGGALVRLFARNSSAYRAGLRPNDLIVGVNGHKISDADELDRVIIQTPIGSMAKVDFLRNGRPMTLQVPVVIRQ
jgi:S1-C subfamily serine protease